MYNDKHCNLIRDAPIPNADTTQHVISTIFRQRNTGNRTRDSRIELLEIKDVYEVYACGLGGLSTRQCRRASLSSEYPFLTDITGKFVLRSDISKTSKQRMSYLMVERETEREGESRERERESTSVV